ncbi:MAG: hypothetical protein ACJAZO_003937 [Myxococcota bacterium]
MVIQRAVDAHKVIMDCEFGDLLTDITVQAAEEKAAPTLEGKTPGGGVSRADPVAGKRLASNVKENYATALRTLSDALAPFPVLKPLSVSSVQWMFERSIAHICGHSQLE